MKVRVDPERCQGHTPCFPRAPEMFELSEIDGHSSPIAEKVVDGQENAVIEAVRSCPERAISVI